MYCEYFGLREAPFSIAPNPRYLFMSEQHQEALAHLLYGIRIDGGFVLLTGEVGTGKTTVSRQLIEQLPQEADVALILNPRLSALELLQSICDELRIGDEQGSTPTFKRQVDRIYRHLLNSHAQGRNTILIIDEAQQMSPGLLELVRLLTNLETSEHKLLKIVLIGQPELLELLAREDLRQLSQRITARYHLGPLSPAELDDYMRHRLAVAGLDRPVFPAPTLKQLYKLSGGIPRVVNLISDRALLGAFVQKQNEVSVATLKQAAREVFGEDLPTPRNLRPRRSWLLAGAMATGILAWAVGLGMSLLYSETAMPGWFHSITAWVENDESVTESESTTGIQPASPPSAPSLSTSSDATLAALPPQPQADLLMLTALVESTLVEDAGPPASEPGSKNLVLETADLDAPARDSPALKSPALESAASENLARVNSAPREAAPAAPAVENPPATAWPLQSDPDLALVQAYRKLFQLWSIDYDPRLQPRVCDFAEQHELGCLTLDGDVELLDRLDTPAVAQLTRGTQRYEIVVASLGAEQAQLYVSGEKLTLPRAELAQGWSGQFTLLWQQPPGYLGPLWPGASGDTVRWLDVQLARVDGQVMTRPEKHLYDPAMVRQVRHFQQQNGLTVDGVVGPRTLIHLNRAVQSNLPRLSTR